MRLTQYLIKKICLVYIFVTHQYIYQGAGLFKFGQFKFLIKN